MESAKYNIKPAKSDNTESEKSNNTGLAKCNDIRLVKIGNTGPAKKQQYRASQM